MRIYIASSWKNQHAVEMLTERLRERGHTVFSFVENNHGENDDPDAAGGAKKMPFDEWCLSESGRRSFEYDTGSAANCDCTVYIGPSGCDAWAEVGIAWANRRPVLCLLSKGEQVGLMRRLGTWHHNYRELLKSIDMLSGALKNGCERCTTTEPATLMHDGMRVCVKCNDELIAANDTDQNYMPVNEADVVSAAGGA